jgi:hypothetical protein
LPSLSDELNEPLICLSVAARRRGLFRVAITNETAAGEIDLRSLPNPAPSIPHCPARNHEERQQTCRSTPTIRYCNASAERSEEGIVGSHRCVLVASITRAWLIVPR